MADTAHLIHAQYTLVSPSSDENATGSLSIPTNSWTDQPPTQAGNARTRVFVACQACRSRKIKCDGLKPVCTNCLKKEFAPGPSLQHLLTTNEHYKLENGVCLYDPLPKRRGPDRQPGTRIRKKPPRNEESGHERVARRRNPSGTKDPSAPGISLVDDPTSTIPPHTSADAEAHSHYQVVDGGQASFAFAEQHPRQAQQISPVQDDVPVSATDLPHANKFYAPQLMLQTERRGLPPQLELSRLSPPGSSNSPESSRSPQRVQSLHQETQSHVTSVEVANQSTSRNMPRRTSTLQPISSMPVSTSPLSESPVVSISRGNRRTWEGAEAVPLQAYPDNGYHYLATKPSFEYVSTTGAYIRNVSDSETDEAAYGMPMTPGASFVQKTWFDSLLDTYASFDPPSGPGAYAPTVTSEIRRRAQLGIFADIKSLFSRGQWWLSFIHLPSFWAKLHSPEVRTSSEVQPSLLLSTLALAVFIKSSDLEDGRWGRERSARLKTEAEAAIESSLAVGWVDIGLAQAAWMLAYYETYPHPYHSLEKTRSAMCRLDNVLRLLKCSTVDIGNPTVTRFDSKATPLPKQALLPPSPRYDSGIQNNTPNFDKEAQFYSQNLRYTEQTAVVGNVGGRYQRQYPQETSGLPASVVYHSHHSPHTTGCRCRDLNLAKNYPEYETHTPLWAFTASWPNRYDMANIAREEARRVVWAFVNMASAYCAHTAMLGADKISDVFWSTSSENFALLYPGESLIPSHSPYNPQLEFDGKNTIWALYNRAQLLWLTCLRLRHTPTMTSNGMAATDQSEAGLYSLYVASRPQQVSENALGESQVAAFAMKAWLQAEEIEKALDAHTCDTERAFMYYGREYLSSVRMIMTQDFSRYVPIPNSGTDRRFNRLQADDWLRHQSEVSNRMMQGMRHVTGMAKNVLADRPQYVWWFMIQVVRLLNLWACDPSMVEAIRLCFAFLRPIDYLTALWPCENQRNKYLSLRQRLDDACHHAGIPPPPGPNLSLDALRARSQLV